MKTFRHPWLTLFLIFCLPAQALAAVLVECEQHVTEHHDKPPVSADVTATHAHASVSETPDCHGAMVSQDSSEPTAGSPSAFSLNADADTNNCYHCSGACQNLKPLSLDAKAHLIQAIDNKEFSNHNQATTAGIRNNPARPPCLPFLS